MTPHEAKTAREALALSQSRVATEIGINRTYVSLFEAGRYILDDASISKLQSLYEAHGYDFGNAAAQNNSVQPTRVTPTEADTDSSENAHLEPIVSILGRLRKSATDTGIDSKRIGTVLALARSALSQLDYPSC